MRDTIQIVNLVLAFSAILPTSVILNKLVCERKLVEVGDRKLNTALTIIFIAILLGAITNFVIALLAILELGLIAHKISPIFRLGTNTFFAVSSWAMYFVDKELN